MNNKQPYTLVTGASGLVGFELVKQLLNKQVKVKAVYNKTELTGIQNDSLQLVQCDLLDVVGLEEIMYDVSEVYHCAGLISYSSKSRSALYKINVEATANVVNASLNAGIRKLIHVSSVAALGKFVPGIEISEASEWTEDARNSEYGYSKYLGEMEVWRGVAEGLNAVIVNPSIILGAGDWTKGSTAIFRNIYEGFKWYSEGKNGFVDVRDVATAMIQLMDSDIHSERFILNAENCYYRDLFFSIADAFQKPRPSKKITPLLAALVWRLEWFKSLFSSAEPLITKETAYTALASVQFNNKKLLSVLPGFSYKPLQQTITDTCNLLQQMVNKS